MASTLTRTDYQRAADELRVDLAAIQAVAAVESRGSGFLPDGRPQILFERHLFFRLLKQHGRAPELVQSRHATLCNPQPGGYLGGVREWDRLNLASTIDLSAALQSCSWGKFQILGLHWKLLGYLNVQAFVAAMEADEAHHLDAFVRFLQANPSMVRALRAQDWAGFSARYNGPNYSVNKYDSRLADAFAAAQKNPGAA